MLRRQKPTKGLGLCRQGRNVDTMDQLLGIAEGLVRSRVAGLFEPPPAMVDMLVKWICW